MNGFVQVPSKGQPMTAQWGADVANGLNAIRPAGQAGMLLTDGQTGTGFAPLPANLRDRRRIGEANPQLFTLRSFIEKNENGQSRLAVEWYEMFNIPKFRWNKFNKFPFQPGTDGPIPSWVRAFTGDWTDDVADINEDVYVYLNINLDVEVDWRSAAVIRPNPDCGAYVSTTPIEETYKIFSTPNNLLLRTANLIGSVKAIGTSIKVNQVFTGPLIFADFIMGENGVGDGSEGDIYGTNYPMPFQYKRTDEEDPDSGEISSSWAIVNNTFYWDGVLKSLSDFTPPATCTVYLCCTQAAPSSSGEAEWQFSIATSEAQAQDGGRVVNYKLYDIADNLVTMDYRTTFLEFNSPHKVSHFVVSNNSESTPKVTISTTSGNASIELKPENEQGRLYLTTNGSQAYLRVETTPTRYASIFENGANAGASFIHDGKTIDFRTSELHHGSSMGIHTLRVKDINGTILNEYDVLSTGDIEIIKAQGTVLKDISLQYTNYQLQITKTKVNLATGQETTEGPSTVFTTELHSAQS